MGIEAIEQGVFCIRSDSDEWIMAPGIQHLCNIGICGDTAWFMDRKGVLNLYDIPGRHHLKRLHIGLSWAPVAGSEPEHITVVGSLSGQNIFVLQSTGPYSRRLDIVDARQGRMVASHANLPGSGYRAIIHEQQDGQLLMPSSGRFVENTPDPDGHDGKGALKLGFILVDPKTGLTRTELQEGNDWLHGQFHSPSPDGRYWLKRDPCVLPIRDEPEPRRTGRIFGQRQTTRYYGRSVQIWEASPLRFVRRVTIAWLKAQETPDGGHVDDIIANRDPKTVKRGYQYDRLSELLDERNIDALDYIDMAEFGDPNVRHSRKPISEKWRGLAKIYADFCMINRLNIHGWSGNEAFWVETNGFLTCAGVDGTTSPRLCTERFGLKSNAWVPVAEHPSEVVSLVNRQARVTFYDKGTVVFDGAPSETSRMQHAIPLGQDQWMPSTPYMRPSEDPRVREALKLLDKRKTLKLKLQSLDEADCIAAIDALAAQLGESLAGRARDGEIAIVFQHGKKTIKEDKFFRHVLDTCPGAVGSLDALLRKYVAVTGEWDFLFFKADKGIGLMAHAAYALGVMDGNSMETLRLYAGRIDPSHEHFFCNETLPAIIKAHGHTPQILQLAIWVMLFRSGNSIMPETIWHNLGVRQMLNEMMEYAEAVTLFRYVLENGGKPVDLDTLAANDFLGGVKTRLTSPGDLWSENFFKAVIG